jgi:acyl carrier protein
MPSRGRIETIVLDAVRLANMARPPHSQLPASPDAPLFGRGSPLDSLGLVALVIDVEDALRDEGLNIDLSDARAMSETRSPFRTVQSLVDYIMSLLDPAGPGQ